jgi:hypothetical protein
MFLTNGLLLGRLLRNRRVRTHPIYEKKMLTKIAYVNCRRKPMNSLSFGAPSPFAFDAPKKTMPTRIIPATFKAVSKMA